MLNYDQTLNPASLPITQQWFDPPLSYLTHTVRLDTERSTSIEENLCVAVRLRTTGGPGASPADDLTGGRSPGLPPAPLLSPHGVIIMHHLLALTRQSGEFTNRKKSF